MKFLIDITNLTLKPFCLLFFDLKEHLLIMVATAISSTYMDCCWCFIMNGVFFCIVKRNILCFLFRCWGKNLHSLVITTFIPKSIRKFRLTLVWTVSDCFPDWCSYFCADNKSITPRNSPNNQGIRVALLSFSYLGLDWINVRSRASYTLLRNKKDCLNLYLKIFTIISHTKNWMHFDTVLSFTLHG